MDKKSDQKRRLILSKAKEIFIKKGFNATKMKDIIEACGISRGGIYLYFQSVDEIFMQVILLHHEKKLKEARDYLQGDTPFAQLLDAYFARQKKRWLNIGDSLLMAMYEYRFAHKDDYDKAFFHGQFENTKAIILTLLDYGVQRGEISGTDIEELAINIMFFIEGISMLGTAAGISEALMNQQISFVKTMILSHKSV